MSDLRTAAQQALEALQWHYRQGHSNTLGGFRLKIDEKALRELSAALAQQGEPVATHRIDSWGFCGVCRHDRIPGEGCARQECPDSPQQAEPVQEPAYKVKVAGRWHDTEPLAPAFSLPDGEHLLYTAPPQRKPLTEEEIGRFCDEVYWSPRQLVRAVERAHGIKE